MARPPIRRDFNHISPKWVLSETKRLARQVSVEAAVEFAASHVKLDPNQPFYWQAVGRAYLDAGKRYNVDALESLSNAMALSPRDPRIIMDLARAQYLERHYEESEKLYFSLFDIEGTNNVNLTALGNLYQVMAADPDIPNKDEFLLLAGTCFREASLAAPEDARSFKRFKEIEGHIGRTINDQDIEQGWKILDERYSSVPEAPIPRKSDYKPVLL